MRNPIVASAMWVACVPAIAQTPADMVCAQPGTLIPVGTHRLNFDCMGSGSPTVVTEGGFADWAPAFFGLQERVAAFTRVCSYDRAGLGFSEPARCRGVKVFAQGSRGPPTDIQGYPRTSRPEGLEPEIVGTA
jgi:hypothetical protein